MPEFGPFFIDERFVVFKTKLSYVFTNLRPAHEGHLLVSPLHKVQYFDELTSEEKMDLISTAKHVGEVMKQKLNMEGLNITIQDGPAAGQTVPHVHMHIIPIHLPTHWVQSPNIPDDVRAQTTDKYKAFFQ